jgi:hypothetical protein
MMMGGRSGRGVGVPPRRASRSWKGGEGGWGGLEVVGGGCWMGYGGVGSLGRVGRVCR